ncbi:uncharacterized protein LOC117568104 [Drosophila albomicans]|uniref:Uncharacterized protein LOC117568104 n=1 Tax=Drosophila albomicans TaxID=7291 RepID=A0A6P8Y7E5_DROAB|nr:uncharacterized protein LOC117568104 [Drosophila albomicans]
MVVCALQSFATGQQLDACGDMNSTQQSAQIKDAEIVDNGNGAEEEDREEGEIVDDFEMIISSEDEEFKLRARIQQLEDKSKDIEKMEMLSANLANQYNYQRPHRIDRYTPYQHFSPISVLSDVSSLSEEEFEPPKKYRRHKSKRTESKKHGQVLRRNPFARREHQLKKKRRHSHYCQQQQAAILLDSLEDDDEIGEYDGNAENENDDFDDLAQLKLSRDKLRVALARTGSYDLKPKHSLKERLQYRLRKSPSPNSNSKEQQLKRTEELSPRSLDGYTQQPNKVVQVDQQEQQSQDLQDDDTPELKLRLIALKSAMLKKHLARKKRDAERAYSPTDMINRVHQPNISHECDDIDDLMEISPAASPERTTYSPPPSNFVEPVDMDLAQTDSDDERQQWADNWQTTVNREESWNCFVPNSLPPVSMPIVVDDDDEEEQLAQQKRGQFNYDDDEVPPPPPSYHIPHMHLEDDDARDALHLSEQQSRRGSLSDIQSISMDNSQTQTQSQLTSDDEAGALRALLLSKLKPTAKQVERVVAEEKSETHDSDDPDQLRLLLLSSIASKKKTLGEETPEESPEILKKAVRRFQVTSDDHDIPIKQAEAMLQPSAVPFAVVEELQTAPLPVPAPELDPYPSPPQPAVEAAEVPSVPAPTTTLHSSPTDIIKIVKPNKVINKKTAPKRKISKLTQAAPPLKRPTTLLVKEPVAPLHIHNAASTTRLITTVDPNSIKVNKLVITLAESSAGSDDELELRSCYTSYAEYQSPLSQAMDSASNSTTRSNTPNSEILDSTAPSNNNLRRTVINEYFEKKLDDFLKQARSKVPTPSPLASEKPPQEATKTIEAAAETIAKPAPLQPSNKVKPTPVAVRHLPVASQKEYLLLIERMRLLEKKKLIETAKGTANTVNTARKIANAATTNGTSAKAVKKTQPALKKTGTGKAEAEGSRSPTEATTVKANKTKELSGTSKLLQPSKESRLKAFENSFLKIGGSMVTNLEKSLHMVEEARMSKIARLRYERRLEELYAELQVVKQSVKLEEAKLSRIQPEIQASHEIIISLKQKRNKLRNAAMDLGTDLQGSDYRLLDPGKSEIMHKSTLLTKEIRLYNSIATYEDTLDLPTNATSENTVQGDVTAETEVEADPAHATDTTPSSNESPATSPAEPDSSSVEPEPEQEQEQPVASDAIETDAGVDEATIRLDVDTTPEAAAPNANVPASPAAVQMQDVPPYTVSFMRELSEAPVSDSLLGEYRTPMSRNYNSQLNINATICPFDLMGRCEDVDCSYLHLERTSHAATAVDSKTH